MTNQDTTLFRRFLETHTNPELLVCLFVVCFLVFGCHKEMPRQSPVEQAQPDPEKAVETVSMEIIRAIEDAGGKIERDAKGVVAGVNLAAERTSVTNAVLRQALLIPNLKNLAVAGGSLSYEAFSGLAKQQHLETLFLQDVPLTDSNLEAMVASVPTLRRLTLRRLNKVGEPGITAALETVPLQSLALIEMSPTRVVIEKIAGSPDLRALDLRQCSNLTQEDYRILGTMTRLADLKIGGFAVDDSVLEILPGLPQLRGLSIEGTSITGEGFAELASHEEWAAQLELLVLARNTAIYDAGLDSLRAFRGLKRLAVSDMMVTGVFFHALAETETIRTRLESLSFPKTYLTAQNMRVLNQFPNLKKLDLSHNMLTPDILEAIAELKTVEQLNLTGCQLDDTALETVRKMQSLKVLTTNSQQ
ncbi:MAG: hypothetical protein FWH27_00135 [Planctomycetaceae bacterium]|nr:hypothetical protein [Planctomycetaceae bacterium]